MTSEESQSIELIDDEASVQFVEVLRFARIDRTVLLEFVEVGLVAPLARDLSQVDEWRFARRDVRKVRSAQRLIADLQLNAAGAALVLDLLEERDTLRRRLRTLGEFNQDF